MTSRKHFAYHHDENFPRTGILCHVFDVVQVWSDGYAAVIPPRYLPLELVGVIDEEVL